MKPDSRQQLAPSSGVNSAVHHRYFDAAAVAVVGDRDALSHRRLAFSGRDCVMERGPGECFRHIAARPGARVGLTITGRRTSPKASEGRATGALASLPGCPKGRPQGVPDRGAQRRCLRAVTYSGVLSWRRRGSRSLLLVSICSAAWISRRVSAGSITASIVPRSAATYGLSRRCS